MFSISRPKKLHNLKVISIYGNISRGPTVEIHGSICFFSGNSVALWEDASSSVWGSANASHCGGTGRPPPNWPIPGHRSAWCLDAWLQRRPWWEGLCWAKALSPLMIAPGQDTGQRWSKQKEPDIPLVHGAHLVTNPPKAAKARENIP